jgi:two-component system chemotaxis response regulator CheY
MGRVFIVDDEVFIQDLYQAMLPAAGHEIIDSAFNGQEAVEKFRALPQKPDLTIMDHRMPIKNGLDATKEILAVDPTAKILVISADATVQPKYEGSGAKGFLEKPFTMDLLFSAITVTINGAGVKLSK